MRNDSESCGENQKKYIMFSNFSFLNHANYDLMWKNKVDPDRPQTTIQGMLISCWIKAKNTIEIHISYCFFMETIVLQKHVNVTLICTLPVLLISEFYLTVFFCTFATKLFRHTLNAK